LEGTGGVPWAHLAMARCWVPRGPLPSPPPSSPLKRS